MGSRAFKSSLSLVYHHLLYSTFKLKINKAKIHKQGKFQITNSDKEAGSISAHTEKSTDDHILLIRQDKTNMKNAVFKNKSNHEKEKEITGHDI